MSFLQINNANPSEKRPFRLSDIQDIWNGIKSLFKAIAGSGGFRIISGFDLIGDTYSSGTVWYNGELYEYDSAAYPITSSTTQVSFTRIAQDDRTLEGGEIQPFSYKCICGGESLNGEIVIDDFVTNIERCKTFLGKKSVTIDKMADSSVGLTQLELPQRIVPYGQSFRIDAGGATFEYLDNLINSVRSSELAIIGSGETQVSIRVKPRTAHNQIPLLVQLSIRNESDSDARIDLVGPTTALLHPILKTYVLSPNQAMVLLLARASLGGSTYYTPVNEIVAMPQ